MPLSPQCGDVGCNVLGLNSCKRHGRHPGVWIHQERGQPIDVEVRLARNGRERRGFRRRLALIGCDDVAGYAPAAGNLPAVVGVRGRRGIERDDRKYQGKERRYFDHGNTFWRVVCADGMGEETVQRLSMLLVHFRAPIGTSVRISVSASGLRRR